MRRRAAILSGLLLLTGLGLFGWLTSSTRPSPALLEALDDEDEEVSDDAAVALVRLGWDLDNLRRRLRASVRAGGGPSR